MKKFFGVAVTLIITLYLLIEFIGDRLIKNILQNNISSALNREVSIENLNIDYLSGEANAKRISAKTFGRKQKNKSTRGT